MACRGSREVIRPSARVVPAVLTLRDDSRPILYYAHVSTAESRRCASVAGRLVGWRSVINFITTHTHDKSYTVLYLATII